MNVFTPNSPLRLVGLRTALVLLLLLALLPGSIPAQSPSPEVPAPVEAQTNPFRLETRPIEGGAELLTVFGRLDGVTPSEDGKDVPLVSVLRDTFGDTDPENDRLRYLWTLTFTRPSLGQRLAGAVPFLYSRVGNKTTAKGVPPPVIDLGAPDKQVWERFFWMAIQGLVLDTYGTPLKASTRTYRQNLSDYRKAHVMRALAVLSLYQNLSAESPALTDSELRDIQARLALDPKVLGGIVDEIRLPNYARKEASSTQDIRGHNWELLRQYSEAAGLYFDPLTMPDGSVTHALVWVSRSDLDRYQGRKFDKRFLNFADPWSDQRLLKWDGYTETRYFGPDGQQVAADTPGARSDEFIPLALYGLDYPKIPIMLVDFRDRFNPKKREMSRRALDDAMRNIVGISSWGNLPYFFGRYLYDFVTGRRGMDLNQPSRLKSYSQLKLLLSLDSSLDPELRKTIAGRLEDVSLNPMENDLDAETKLARQQYAALVEYAGRPDGLPRQLALDRRAEMVPLRHGKAAQAWFRIANLATLGAYTHREGATPELVDQLEVKRRLDFHGRFLREVARSPRIEVAWNVPDVMRSLQYVAAHGATANGKTATAIAQIFRRTDDIAVRRLCVDGLYRINNERAKTELLALYRTDVVDPAIKDLTANYLRQAVRQEMRISRNDFRAIVNVIGQ